jgi:hypothetical protein
MIDDRRRDIIATELRSIGLPNKIDSRGNDRVSAMGDVQSRSRYEQLK